jgi:aerobic carbon-monoxide dehydrogenase medium subunit
MKAAAFDYVRAHDLGHALALLAQHGPDAKPIAGGQSLVPMMAMRLVRPAWLVDINRVAEIKGSQTRVDSVLMGAATRQRDVLEQPNLNAELPLVRDALLWVGHVQTRNRGTVGGSLAHADPAAELPLAAQVLGATLLLQSKARGPRRVVAQDFFVGAMTTALAEDECLVAIEWPRWQPPAGARVRSAFDEIAQRRGDFAMAAAACQVQLDAHGRCQRASLGLGGLGGTPVAFPDLAQQLIGQRIQAPLAQAVARAAAARCEPGNDTHASTEYRRELGAVLLERVLLRAAA